MPAGDGFGRLLRAEWTKLRSVLGTAGCLLAVLGSILAVAVLISAGSPGTYDHAGYVDEFRFVHRTLTGDVTLVAAVRTQDGRHPWAMAGIMVKQSATPGAPYAALMVTPGHGIRIQSNFSTDIAGPRRTTPHHLKLTRTGDTIIGYESIDAVAWTEVGTVTLAALPSTVEVGLFVTSPGMTRIHPMRPGLVQIRPGTATFDAVHLTAEDPQPAMAWQGHDVGATGPADRRRGAAAQAGPGPDGVFTLTGSGDIIGRADDGSRIIAATAGTIFGALPAIALGALVMTSEYRWRSIWTTLAASPRRGRVLAAKAVVATGATFIAGLVGALVALQASQPLLRRNGYRPPTYADPALSDPTTLRIIVGTAAFLALLALLSLGVGTILRRSAGAITVVAATVLVPVVVAPFLPPDAATWLQRLTPTAGLSVQQFRETDDAFLLPWAGQPWSGFGVLCCYAAVVSGIGYWLLRRRDA